MGKGLFQKLSHEFIQLPSFTNASLRARGAWLSLITFLSIENTRILDPGDKRLADGPRILDPDNLPLRIRKSWKVTRNAITLAVDADLAFYDPSGALVVRGFDTSLNATSPSMNATSHNDRHNSQENPRNDSIARTDQDQDRDGDQEQEQKQDSDRDQELEQIYKSYPRKEGKTVGLEKARKEIKTKDDLELLRVAVSNYGEMCVNKETQYIKSFATFMDCWRDYAETHAPTRRELQPLPRFEKVEISAEERAEVEKSLREFIKKVSTPSYN